MQLLPPLRRRATRRVPDRIFLLQPSHRSYTVDAIKDHRRGTGGQIRHIISTLTSDRIIPSDYIDVSNRRTLTIRFPLSPGHGTKLCFKGSSAGARLPFPDNTYGFLYSHRHPHAASLEGSIRLRVTPSGAPSSFFSGQDLCLPSGIPWRIILPQIALRKDLAHIRDQLLRENLVTLEQLSRCRRLFAKSTHIFPPTTIFRLDQDFPLELSTPQHITAVGKRLHTLRVNFFEAGVDKKTLFPWTGSAIVRFEPSTSPQHTGRRVVTLRIVKLITPVSSTIKGYRGRISKPEEGELLTVSHHGGPPEPFGYDIDRHTTTTAAALRDLWDYSSSASRTPESQPDTGTYSTYQA
ncbi:hypothetical protein DFH06DRAFT_1486465 [Mycena polygramma]|nr:hypothetical protein DFH06DRAFT_1486465 [Mycena polygramma]